MMSDDMQHADPIVRALERSTVAQTLKAARASLHEPSRPFTPLDRDRTLFQSYDPGATARPSSSYSVDQLRFVESTFGGGPSRSHSSRGSSKGSGSRYQTIVEEEEDGNNNRYQRNGNSEVLRLDEDSPGSGRRRPSMSPEAADESSGSEELAPVNTSTSSAARGGGGLQQLRPPRPPVSNNGGYPSALAAIPPTTEKPDKTSKRRSKTSASPHRRDRSSKSLMSSTPPGTPGRSSEVSCNGDDWGAQCHAALTQLQSIVESSEERRRTSEQELRNMVEQVASIVSDARFHDTTRSNPAAPGLLRVALGLLELKDLKDVKVLFKVARCALIMLAMDVAVSGVSATGVENAYLNIAKLLLKYSKNQGYDTEFLEADLLVPLLELLQSDKVECRSNELRVFIVGVLKNVVFVDEGNQNLLVQKGAVHVLFNLMSNANLVGSKKEEPLLIQITATLRSLAGHGYTQFITDDRPHTLTKVMELYPNNVELLTNVSRTLAKLTVHGSACEAYTKSGDTSHLRRITRTLSANADCAPLVLRLSFTLGNLTARNDRTRIGFAFDCEGNALAPTLLSKYWQKDRQLARLPMNGNSSADTTTAAAKQEVEEVLVKLVRLIANIAIERKAGETLASCSAAVDPLLDMLGSKRIGDSEELVLNVVAAITNLLYYDVPSSLLFLEDNKTLLCRLFRPLLLESYNVEALVETARALGNLSRHEDARRCMAEIRLDEILTILLDHADRDLVFYVCGALVNLASDPECTPRLTSACPVVTKLGKLLRDACEAAPEDTALQLVAVKVLTNLSRDAAGATWSNTASEDVREALQQILAEAPQVEQLEPDDAEEMRQLLDLSQQLLARLAPAAPVANTGGEWTCPVPGCLRRFPDEAKLAAHMDRRHAELR